MEFEFFVPDIACAHCKMRIEQRLRELAGVRRVQVDVASKTVRVAGDIEPAVVRQAIGELGYTV